MILENMDQDTGDNNVGSALVAGAAIGNIKKISDENSRIQSIYLVPKGYIAEAIERPEIPFRHRGFAKLNDARSFEDYYNLHATESNSKIYAQLEPVCFTGLLNDHYVNLESHTTPGWKDYGCTYSPKFSKEYQQWTGRNKQGFDGNEKFALWLEDNLTDVISPATGELLEVALNFRVNSNVSMSNPIQLTNGKTEFNYTKNIEGSSNTKAGKVTIPEAFIIEIPIFEGRHSPLYKIDARFRYRLTNSSLSIWFELVRPHKVVEQAFNDMCDQIQKNTETTLFYGEP